MGWQAWEGMDWAPVVFGIELLVKISAVGIVPEKRQPSSSSAWLLLILVVPVIGLPAYFLLGSAFMRGKRQRIHLEANRVYSDVTRHWPTAPVGVHIEPGLRSIMEMNRTLTHLPASTGTCLALYQDYTESLDAMTAAVMGAHEFVHVEFYAQSWDNETEEFYEALIAAAGRGVTVRVLADHLGSVRYHGFRPIRRRLERAGVEFHMMLPVNPFVGPFRRPDLRNHRKLLIVDGREAFAGSQNLIDRYYGRKRNRRAGRQWVDVMVHMGGEVVDSLDAIFAADWYIESGVSLDDVVERLQAYQEVPVGGEVNVFQVVPSGPGYQTEPSMRMFAALINNATRTVRIVSPYFVPNETLLDAIKTAVYRGVKVELLVPEKADQFAVHHAQQSYFRELLEAGVELYRFPAPQVLHAKMMIIDGTHAYFGSANMDIRSFILNFEVSILVFGGNAVSELDAVVDSYQAQSAILDLDTWMRRPLIGRYFDNVFRLTSALQ